MSYAILRVEKHKTPGTLGSALKHALRERPTPNADPARGRLNRVHGASSAAAGLAKVRELFDALECKPRHRSGKNAPVLCVEYFVGMSPDAAIAADHKQSMAYLRDALAWISEKHGAHNVVAAQAHFDETTPHLSVFVFPELAGKLNAKAFLGGRKLLADMQTDFAKRVGERHGLERGVERSQAQHGDVADWYATVKERDALRLEVAGLRKDVTRLSAEVERLTGVMNALEPALRGVVEERAARALADAQATKAPPRPVARVVGRSDAPPARPSGLPKPR